MPVHVAGAGSGGRFRRVPEGFGGFRCVLAQNNWYRDYVFCSLTKPKTVGAETNPKQNSRRDLCFAAAGIFHVESSERFILWLRLQKRCIFQESCCFSKPKADDLHTQAFSIRCSSYGKHAWVILPSVFNIHSLPSPDHLPSLPPGNCPRPLPERGRPCDRPVMFVGVVLEHLFEDV